MSEQSAIPSRLNGVIGILESGGTAFLQIASAGVDNGFTVGASPYDGVMYEMEHKPFQPAELRLTLQSMLSRRQIATSGSIAPKVTPLVRIPPNGAELSQWAAKQALDSGVYGLVWPHTDTVEQAHNAVASSRYPRPPEAPYYEPFGLRGDAPSFAAAYWGLTQQEYYTRADVWPLNPAGELLVIIQIEGMEGVRNLPAMLEKVPGIGAVMIGEGDLSQELGVPRQYEHPTVVAAMDEVLAACREFNVPCAHPHGTTKNVEEIIEKGYRLVFTAPVTTYAALETGRRLAAEA